MLAEDTNKKIVTSGSMAMGPFPTWRETVEGDYLVRYYDDPDRDTHRWMTFDGVRRIVTGHSIVSVEKVFDGKYIWGLSVKLDDGTELFIYDSEQYGTQYGLQVDGVEVEFHKEESNAD